MMGNNPERESQIQELKALLEGIERDERNPDGIGINTIIYRKIRAFELQRALGLTDEQVEKLMK